MPAFKRNLTKNSMFEKMRKKNVDNSVKFAAKKVHHFLFYLFVIVDIEFSNIN